MGGLYQRVAAFESERIADSHAERLAWQICDTLSALRLMRLRASTLYDAHQPLQSLMILDSIIQFCNKHGLPEQTKIIYPMRIKYHIETNNALSADSLLREYEQKMNIQPLTPDEKIIDITHFYRKGLYYNLIEQPDSAIMMFQKLIRLINIRSLYTVGKYDLREGAFKGLSEAYSYKHQADSVIKYANLYCQWNDSSIRARASEHLLRFQSLYNYTKIQEQALNAEQKASRLRVIIILLVFFATTIVIVAWSIYQKRLKKERQKQIDTNKGYQSLLHEIEKSAEELQLVKTDSERFLKEKELEIYYCPLNIDIPIPTLCNTGVGMFYYLRQAPTSVFLGVWRRFCRIFKHQFHVRVRHIEECVYIEVLHHDNPHHCRQARETPTSFQGTLEQ
jgi:hypothetical protein